MTLHDNAYAAFLLDYAAGTLSPAERLAADIHRALSPEGGRNVSILEVVGGAVLERSKPFPASYFNDSRLGALDAPPVRSTRLDPYLNRDLLALNWRKDIFGVKTLPTGIPMASLLRLDPGERAPSHLHGRRDVTVVLMGAYADEFGAYERGDIAFAEPGLRHQPRAEGDKPCVCLLATEPGRPLQGLLGLFGLGDSRPRQLS